MRVTTFHLPRALRYAAFRGADAHAIIRALFRRTFRFRRFSMILMPPFFATLFAAAATAPR